ncbi:response regulator transcription factor [Rubricoccus marinus]|uniref:response regulator transcription factor n=1 Tax=Rubricoccus marinus TaxID=716817 RepID=UPI0015C5D21F|nr:response regulator transcription factor [Rubricoccus marinus]
MIAPAIFLVDDHSLTRAGLRLALATGLGARICGEASGAEEAYAGIERLRHAGQTVDLVVVDVTLACGNGLDLVRRLCESQGPPALVVSMHPPEVYASRAREAGARGFLSKSLDDEGLIAAARTVLAGRTVFGPDVPSVPCEGIEGLSDRELEVFCLLGRGYAPRHIADALDLSVSTVEAYRQRIRWKLGISSAPLLTRHAVAWTLEQERAQRAPLDAEHAA